VLAGEVTAGLPARRTPRSRTPPETPPLQQRLAGPAVPAGSHPAHLWGTRRVDRSPANKFTLKFPTVMLFTGSGFVTVNSPATCQACIQQQHTPPRPECRALGVLLPSPLQGWGISWVGS